MPPKSPGRNVTALTWGELADAVDHVQEAGGRVPCREGDLESTKKWISSDPTEQRRAAAACAECTPLAMCREYAEANPLAAGVLGGLTETDRKPKVGRPKSKETKR